MQKNQRNLCLELLKGSRKSLGEGKLTVLVDSWAWVGYFKGTELGKKAKDVIESGKKLLISAINISEVYHFLLKYRDKDAEKLINFMLKSSFIIALDTNIAIKAAKLKHIYKMGLTDAIVLATAEENNAEILTGDSDFKNMKNVIYMGK